MLRLTSLTLSHFRSYGHVSLRPERPLVALHGPNGAGKTNLLEAISLLSPGRGMRRAKADAFQRRPDNIGWKITASLTGPDGLHEIVTTAPPNTPSRNVEIDGKPAPQVALGKIARIVWLTPSMDRLWTDAAAERRAFLDRLTMGLDPEHADRVLTYEKAMRERNRLLRDEVRDPSWYDAIEAQLAASGAALIAARQTCLDRLSDAQRTATTSFPRATLSLDSGEGGPAQSEADIRVALAEGRVRDYAAGRTLTGPHRADLIAVYSEKDMPARYCSTGEQKALLVSLVLASARAVAAEFGAPPVLLLDEIAAHLDSNRRAALFRELEALNAQAFMSGTGEELFSSLGDQGEMHFVSENDGLSKLTSSQGSLNETSDPRG